jgi:hypothetical protein
MLKGVQIFAAALALSGAAVEAQKPASLVKLETTSRITAYEGKTFGQYGPYERIAAVAHMRIDPRAPANRRIVDLALAPRDADGMVSYDVDLIILRPKDAVHARRVLLYDVVNRGVKLASMLNAGQAGIAADPFDAGDGLLMRQGYTIVWSGWQGDIAGKGLVGARFPVATDKGKPVTGRISTETIFDNSNGDRITLPYPAASLAQATAQLTVRAHADDRPVPIGASEWRFEDDRHVRLKRPANMDAGAIYRFDYVARDPKVMGLGFAATRDIIAFLRHASAAEGNPLADLAAAPCERDAGGACTNPAGGIFSTTVAIGGSQSARYLRDFLWQGFNADLAGRRVFDGMIPFIAGGRQTFTNFRFSEPGRFSRQHEDHNVPGFVFPFTYATLADPVTGRSDGILRACSATGTCPKIFHIDTGAEFWQAGASLVGTGGTSHDVAFPSNVRAYMIASGAHAAGLAPPICRYPANPMNYSVILRALTVAMIDWAGGRREPPPSHWPSVARSELVPVGTLRGPESPSYGVIWAKVANRPVSPVAGRAWPVLVPNIDSDGNDLPGIRMPQIAAPIGTYLGWNLRKPGFGGDDLCLVYGGFVPFAADKAARGDDPRASLAERYPTPGDRAQRFTQAVEALREQRLLLDEDAATLQGQASQVK